MPARSNRSFVQGSTAIACAAATVVAETAFAADDAFQPESRPSARLEVTTPQLRVGDLVFSRIAFRPFLEVAHATNSWTNHVGVVIDVSGEEPRIAESAFPVSRETTMSRFVKRSENGRFTVVRLKEELTVEQQAAVRVAANRRLGIFYDTGFNLHSRREFCSRYAREVLSEATGRTVGDVETFAHLLASRPDANQVFWKLWYFGRIPWERETVTPASLLRSDQVRLVFDSTGP